MDSTTILIGLVILLASLTVHEAAHAWTADRLGDPTARLLGRVSLNPLVHIDLIGTIILPLLAAFSGLPIVGWAKPVPVNTSQLRHPRRDFVVVAAAGPASNIGLAILAATALRIGGGLGDTSATVNASSILIFFVYVNVLLALFNMIPVPPLDGGNVLAGLLPRGPAETFVRLRPYGFIVLYALMITGALSAMIGPPANLFMRLLLK
ncbi:MAG: site-2 protease family protein [Acidobacteria bacterium]|nr:site-2 protease family protein [Acidobacteriota bacterium]